MFRFLCTFLFAALLVVPAFAQHNDDPDQAVAGGGMMPEGWHVRPDKGTSLDNIKFMAEDGAFHVTLGPAAVFYSPEMHAEGAYTAHATFTQTKAPRHPEAYGLLVGGRNLDNDKQDYLYFLIRQDGKFLIKHRAGSETHGVVAWTEHAAIHKADEMGKATNTLALRSTPDAVHFLVNGTEVTKLDRAPMLKTDGLVGLRVNHNLDVVIENLGIEKAMD